MITLLMNFPFLVIELRIKRVHHRLSVEERKESVSAMRQQSIDCREFE